MDTDKNLVALSELIDEATKKELVLEEQAQQLALKSKDFANYLEQKKRQDAELKVLWDEVKTYMVDNDIKKHETDTLVLSLRPTGKYKAEDVESIPDELCKIKRELDNAKIKAYLELNGELPAGVESTGWVLNKKVKEI